jgi:hypothetical protein
MFLRCFERKRAVLPVLVFSLAVPVAVHAQPWVLPQNEGSVSVLYQHIHVRDHLFSDGSRLDVGHIRTHSTLVDLDYGLTDRLSLSASVPFIAAKFQGSPRSAHTHTDGRTLDDGTYHPAFQDLRVDVRYNAIEFPVTVTPFVALNLPTHDYEFFAHSAVGLGLTEAQVGAYVGAVRTPFYIQGRYSYGLSERMIGRRRSRSNIDTEVGWFIKPTIRVFAFQLGQISHGGLEVFPGFPNLAPEEILHHDPLGRANIMDIGGGVAVALTPSMDVVCGALTTVAGANTHAVQYGLTVGASWTFGRRVARHGSGSVSSSANARLPLSSARVN